VKRSRSLVFALCSCLAISTLAIAQPAAQPGAPPYSFLQVATITVKPSAVPEFESFIKKLNAGAVKIGVSPSNVYAMGRGGSVFTYVTTIRLAKWADLDARPSVIELLTKAYGEAEGAKIGNAGRATIESVSTVVLRVLPELSSAPSLENPFAHVRVSTIAVKPGMGGKWEAYLAKLKAAQDKAGGGLPVLRSTTALGPVNPTYWAAYFFNKYAQLDGSPSVGETLRKAYGEGEARLLEEAAASCMVSLETNVVDYRADLSHPAAAHAAK
jgi:hypothetical protein